MVTSKVGYNPARQNNIRQSAPQRQNVAFGNCRSEIERINSEDRFLKRCILAVPLVLAGTIAAVFQGNKLLDPQNERPQKAVIREVSSPSKAKAFIETSKGMDYFTARDYLIAVADSASGISNVKPSEKFAEALAKIKK